MEPLSFRPVLVQSGMLGYCSFFSPLQALLQQTLDPSPSNAPLETYDDPENGNYMHYSNYIYYLFYSYYFNYVCNAGWLKSVGSQIVYELDHKKPVLFVIPIEHILGKLPVVPVGGTGTIPHHLQVRSVFQGAPGDRRSDAGDGCKMWFVNSWALGWSRDL
jgi:hypothetical protein